MTEAKGLTRREVLASLAVTGGASLVPKPLLAFPWLSGLSVVDGGSRVVGTAEAAPLKVQPFSLNAVRLRLGPFQEAMEINRRYLHSLPNDRLLHTFRKIAGLPSSAEPLRGWENPDMPNFLGHFAGGHYLSACALTYASTGDETLKSKADALVAELAKCQAALNADGFLASFPLATTEPSVVKAHAINEPFYISHKVLAGHLDMYLHCGNTQALATAEGMARWLEKFFQSVSEDDWTEIKMFEYGAMNETLFSLYAITGKEQYNVLARRFDHKVFFDPLLEHRDVLTGLHGNTNIPKIIGTARGYEVTGDPKYRDMTEYFWKEVTSQRCTCTGGTTNNEFWSAEAGTFAGVSGSGWAQECCCAHNMLKLTRHIFSWSADPKAMDYYERTLFNHRLGTQDPNGMLMYFLALQPGAWKVFGTPFDSFWCCTGTGVEEFAKTNDTIYYHDAQNLYVNLFIASDVHWAEKKLRLVQETNFPEEANTRLTMHCSSPVRVALKIRVPYWADTGFAVTVNGKPHHVEATPSTYVTINRTWRDGDTIGVSFPMRLHVEPLPGVTGVQTMMYGPLVLAGRLGAVEKEQTTSGGQVADFPEVPMPEISIASNTAATWVESVPGKSLEFRTVDQSHNIDLMPLYRLFNERYTVYWKVGTPSAP